MSNGLPPRSSSKANIAIVCKILLPLFQYVTIKDIAHTSEFNCFIASELHPFQERELQRLLAFIFNCQITNVDSKLANIFCECVSNTTLLNLAYPPNNPAMCCYCKQNNPPCVMDVGSEGRRLFSLPKTFDGCLLSLYSSILST